MNTRISIALLVAALACPASAVHSTINLAKCTGANNCKACKTCKGCKHCAKDGGKCGVCRHHKPKKPGANR